MEKAQLKFHIQNGFQGVKSCHKGPAQRRKAVRTMSENCVDGRDGSCSHGTDGLLPLSRPFMTRFPPLRPILRASRSAVRWPSNWRMSLHILSCVSNLLLINLIREDWRENGEKRAFAVVIAPASARRSFASSRSASRTQASKAPSPTSLEQMAEREALHLF